RIGQGPGSFGPNSSSTTWTGGIDEVAIYGRALTAAEALLHYQAGQISGSAAPQGTTNVTVRDNTISAQTGILLVSRTHAQVHDNVIIGGTDAVSLRADLAGSFYDNDISRADVGLRYAAAAEVVGNIIHDNRTGVHAVIDEIGQGFGEVGTGLANVIR